MFMRVDRAGSEIVEAAGPRVAVLPGAAERADPPVIDGHPAFPSGSRPIGHVHPAEEETCPASPVAAGS